MEIASEVEENISVSVVDAVMGNYLFEHNLRRSKKFLNIRARYRWSED